MRVIYLNNNKHIDCEEWKQITLKLGLLDKLKKAKNVAIKPNFAAGTYADPKRHIVSDLNLLRSIIEFVHSVNSETLIYIAESDSTGYGFAFLKFEHLELPQSLNLPEETLDKVKLLDMSRDRLQQVKDEKFLRYKNIDSQLWVSKILLNSDFFINLSNLKTHTVTGYTGACKNLFGCLPDFEKYHNHPVIHKTIHDLTIAIKPDLNIVDAFYGMERNGPVLGTDIDSGYRIFSNNALEADIFASQSIGFNPKRIKYVKLLSKTLKIEINTNVYKGKKYRKPSVFIRLMNFLGLSIQKFGFSIETFGHRIHTCQNLLNLFITIFRPILLSLFDYERLKKWKRKILKQ